MKIDSFLKDVGGASRVTKARRMSYKNASAIPQPKDPIRELADLLHPDKMRFVVTEVRDASPTVTEVRDASPTSKTFRLESVDGHIPVFQCGQYVNFNLKIGESVLNRPYSISSAPFEARGEKPFIEVTIRRNRPYFVPDYFFENVTEGTLLDGSMPFGTFYYEPLRDSKNVVALAGGSGITPFVSMAKEIAAGYLDTDLTILYGSVHHSDIVCGDELARAAAACPRVRVVNVMSDDPEWEGEKGFVTKEIIEKYSGEDPTYMFCGPLPMYNFVSKVLGELGVPVRRFRKDVLGQPADISALPGYPAESVGKTYQITVVRGVREDVILASASEPVAVALERAGIPVDAHCRGGECGFCRSQLLSGETHCRGGECGFCRSQLLSGEIFVNPVGDGRRAMDKEMGWFHACSSYPLSDLKIKIPIF